MERNSETKTLSFSKGMTNVPSDLLCEDSELVLSENFIYKDGEMKPIQQMRFAGVYDGKVMHVHKMPDSTNYIAYRHSNSNTDDTYTLTFYITDTDGEIKKRGTLSGVGQVYDIKSIGNTLVVATSYGLRYVRYTGGKYKDLGMDIPEPSFIPIFGYGGSSGLGGFTACDLKEIIESKSDKLALYDKEGNFVKLATSSEADEYPERTQYYSFAAKEDIEKKDAFQTAVQGHAANAIARAKKLGYFLFPFFIRYALKLYDGSYAKISAPILCYPSINRNCRFVPVLYDKTQKGFIETSGDSSSFIMYPYYAKLLFTAKIEGIENWKDIVKELVVFASDDVMPFYLDEEWKFASADETNGAYFYTYPNARDAYPNPSGLIGPSNKFSFTKNGYPAREVLLPTYKSDKEIIDELKGKTQFFKLFELSASSSMLDGYTTSEAPIKIHTIENLTSQEQLTKDDYYGWTKMVANKLYSYNSRINVFDVSRYPFKGFNLFHDYVQGGAATHFKFTYYVHIMSGTMDCWVKSDEKSEFIPDFANAWLFYPDTNATEMLIWDSMSNKGMLVKLEPHPMLNGAYSFAKLPTNDTFSATSNAQIPSVDSSAHEVIDSQIFTSVVNNPFVFEASGDNTVGTGKILGIVANTEAVSQGQFGQYPLLVFTDEGIYAMSVSSEGLYSSIHPISREVCNNADSITPTDKVIYFTSEKGLMATSGGEAVCVSEQLRGETKQEFSGGFIPFRKFTENCVIAYDYKASLLRIFNSSYVYHYVYNMRDKVFAVSSNYVGNNAVSINVANAYPDNLVQFDSAAFSLTKIPLIGDDENLYSGTITTRPLKLGGSMTLKSLRNIKNLRSTLTGKLSLEIWASNNAVNWCKLHSLMGKPWSYFTFRYTLTDFKASDCFAGSVVRIQNRRELK